LWSLPTRSLEYSGVLQPPAVTTGTPREVPDPAREDSGKRPRSSHKEDRRWLKRELKGIRRTLARMKGAGLTREERPVDLDPVVHGNHETCQTARVEVGPLSILVPGLFPERKPAQETGDRRGVPEAVGL
jgi:hypothetical protein